MKPIRIVALLGIVLALGAPATICNLPPGLPPAVATTPAPASAGGAEPSATPSGDAQGVTGSLEIEEGRCCAGGVAGDVIAVQVDFRAASTGAQVTEMRARAGGWCLDEAEMEPEVWRPFVEREEYPVLVALNWVGFYVSAQYRDAAGSVSPVYCDDISIEGMPPSPTP